jgi:predicted ester cyclase
MSSESEANKALIRAHYQATTNDFDPAAIDRQVGEDFYDHAAGTRMGPEGVKQHLTALHAAFPDLEVTIEEMVAEGPIVAVRATWRGTPAAPAGAHPVQFGGMVFWRIADGKIRERWASIDTAAAQPARASAA